MTAPPPPRAPAEGVLNIVRFNWPMFARAGATTLVFTAVACVPALPWWLRAGAGLAALGSFYFIAISLLVSYWIYDLSSLYSLSWVGGVTGSSPRRIVNLNAGFDETTLLLRARFPLDRVEPLDFYNPVLHTEPSIARARAFRPPLPETRAVQPGDLGLEPGGVDLVLGILALHEIRDAGERDEVFRSIARALRLGGRCLVVEHLRDLPNFLAFGPGFFHFFSRAAWLRAMQEAPLQLLGEFTLTPFLRVFILEKIDA